MCFFGVLGAQNLLPLCHIGVLAIISSTRGCAVCNTLRSGARVLPMRLEGAETHSLLHFDISEGRMVDTACMFIVGTPFHCRLAEAEAEAEAEANVLESPHPFPTCANIFKCA